MKQEQIVKDIKLFREYLMCKSDSKATAINYGSAVTSLLFHYDKEFSRHADIPVDKIISYLLRFVNLSTRRNAHSALKSYYQWKCKKGISTKFKFIPYPVKPDTIPDHITKEDFISLMKTCKNFKHKCILLLGFDCGLRVSEVANLKTKDIDSKLMTLTVRLSKKKKSRILKLTTITLSQLRIYYEKYKPQGEFLFNGHNKAPRYSIRSCQQILTDLCKLAGIKHYKFHALRHGFSMMHYETGAQSLETIRDLLGHASVETTKIYARKNNVVIQRPLSPVELMIAEEKIKLKLSQQHSN